MENAAELLPLFKNWFLHYGGTLLYCIVFGFVAWVIFKLFLKGIKKGLHKAKVNEKIERALVLLLRVLFYIVLIMAVLGAFQVPLAPIITFLSAVGLAMSLAFKDTLANFAQGVLLLVIRPFKIGDVIEVDDTTGVVEAIEIFYTRIVTFDNRLILIPNRQLTDVKIVNYTARDLRRLDLTFYLSIGEDFDKAKGVIENTLSRHHLALDNPAPVIQAASCKIHYLELSVRVWTNTGDDYYTLSSDLTRQIPEELQKAGLSLSTPSLAVSLTSKE